MTQPSIFRYSSTKMQGLTPGKVVFYNNVIKWDLRTDALYMRSKDEVKKMPEKRFHDFNISVAAQNNIQQKINWLYQLARSRVAISKSGTTIYNFKMGFITLTLPSAQEHSTAVITNQCLNQFLTELRQEFGLTNYVWRLEFQKNGNVHYHIATDTFLDYDVIRPLWNRCLAKLGYVKRYRDKFNGMTLSNYITNYLDPKKNDVKTLAKRYAHGRASDWTEPPTVDVKSCTSGKSIAAYISKYFGKKDKSGTRSNRLDNEENSSGLRLWFCSRGLSKLKTIVSFHEVASVPFDVLFSSVPDALLRIYDYCTVIYFNYSTLFPEYKRIMSQIYRSYSLSVGYSPAG